MRCISLHQPWASLIALGAKRIETRSWDTSYRGPLAIHAAKKRFGLDSPTADFIRDEIPRETYNLLSERLVSHAHHGKRHFHHCDCEMWQNYPLGAVVATSELVDVVPMVGSWPMLGTHPEGCVYAGVAYGLTLWRGADPKGEPIQDQRPYGDYSAGRFAWILENVKPLAEPVPVVGRQGLFEWDPSALAIAEGVTA